MILRVVKWLSIGILALLAVGLTGFYAYFGVQSANNMALLGDAAPIVEVGGTPFRDLNKNGQLDPYEDFRLSPDQRTDDLLSKMSLEEKAGSMFITMIAARNGGELVEHPNPNDIFSLISPTNSTMVAGKRMNHFNVVFVDGAADLARWHNKLQGLAERTRLGIPVTIATDPRHGFGYNPAASLPAGEFSLWPEPLGMAATGDPALVHQFGDMARQEYLAVGIRLALHPMADLATEPRWARAAGTFGEDAQLSAKLVYAYVKGFQGDELGPNSVATMVKHFSGGGPQAGGEDAHFAYGKEQVYPGDNFDYHLIPFEQGAFPAGAAQIMPYYGIPVGQTDEDVGFAFNKTIITGMLRDKYGFEGVICSDWGLITDKAIKEASAWGVEHLSSDERMIKLLDAGIDQIGGESVPELLVSLVQSGQVSEQRLNQSVRRLMLDKFRLGLFDNPFVDAEATADIVGNEKFVAAGKEAQRRSMVLLKNSALRSSQSALPLQGGNKIYVENISRELAEQYGELVDDPADADLAIVRIKAPFYPHDGFLDSNFHSGDLDFKGEEQQRLLTLMATVPTIVDIYLDRAAVIPQIAELSVALTASFGATDEVLMELLWGEYRPQGKLPFEMPRSMAAVRAQFEDLPYDSVDPLFPFGHGLSYPPGEG
ncbi:MAG: glycoside hydrolase family 3 protein [Halieaceae bacterium]|jgi:beta-glucosidase|nr:glycoside hydrolase family 3 protein [Halieaceae bacterium]